MTKTYVIDTNVLMEDVDAIKNLINGEENKIIIPLTVVYELDALKIKKPGLVKKALAQLKKYEDKIEIIGIPEPNEHKDTEILESICSWIINSYMKDPILVSNDSMMRFIAEQMHNITAQPYLRSSPKVLKAEVATSRFGYTEGKLSFDAEEVYVDTCWGVSPRTDSQKKLVHAILNPDIEVISVNSAAGMGKTFVTLACALYLAFEKKRFRRIKITRPLVNSGQDIGFLPGDLNEKIANYFYPVVDIITDLTEGRNVSKLYLENGELNPRKVQLTPTNYLRGANFYNDFLIIDEAQNLSRDEIRTVLTRCGKGCKVVLLGDINQVDASYLSTENNALAWCVDKLSPYNNYLHLTLEGKNQRGSICDMIINSGL